MYFSIEGKVQNWNFNKYPMMMKKVMLLYTIVEMEKVILSTS